MNDRDRFDRFTVRARNVLSLAREEANRFNSRGIGPEHILLGLVRVPDSAAAKVLGSLGVELTTVRSAVESSIGRGDRIVLGDVGLTPGAKQVIALAVDEAHRLNARSIGTEHLLLGLVREGEGIAAGVLESLGVNLEKVRTQTSQVLAPSGSAGDASALSAPEAPTPAPHGRQAPQRSVPFTAYDQEGGFDRFTERARTALSLAQKEAQRLNHNYLGTEHLLLGLIREGEGVAAVVLIGHGIDLETARAAVERIIGRGDRTVLGDIGLTPRTQTVIALAGDESRRLNHQHIGTEHLLLGLVREGEGIAVGVLESLGVHRDQVRQETLRLSGAT